MLATGSTTGSYRLAVILNQTPYSTLGRAMHMGTDEIVLMKASHLPFEDGVLASRDDTARDLFAHEAKLLSEIDHPNVATVLKQDFGIELPYFTLPNRREAPYALAFRSTTDMLRPKEMVTAGLELLDAVSKIHEAGIVHRDLSPRIIIAGGDQKLEPIICDLGFARRISEDPFDDLRREIHAAREFIGTVGFIAHEVVVGDSLGTVASDIWSLGATLFFMTAGAYASDLLSKEQLDHVNQRATQLGKANLVRESTADKLAGPYYAVLAKAMAANPGDRFQSATEFADALREIPAE